MSDLIKREDAIKALRCEYPTMPLFKGLREEWSIKTEGFRKAEEVIMSIPSDGRKYFDIEYVRDVVTCGECTKRKKNGFCLEHMRYEKNDKGFCSYGERKDDE